MEKKKETKVLKQIGLILSVLLLFLGLQFIAGIALGLIFRSNPDILMNLALAIPNILLILILYLSNKKTKIIPNESLKKNDVKYSILLGLTYVGFGILLTQSVMYLLGDFYQASTSNEFVKQAEELLNSINPIAMILTVGVLAPIAEELMFRGFFIEKSLKNVSKTATIITSAILFGFAHLNLLQGLNAIILGGILAYLYYKTRNVKFCIITHMSNNIAALILGTLYETNKIAGIIVSVALFIAFIYIFKKFKKQPVEYHTVYDSGEAK